MKKISFLIVALCCVAFYNCKDAKKGEKDAKAESEAMVEKAVETDEVKTITFTMEPKSDSNVAGTVTFTEEDGMVKMVAVLSGLTEGEHAIHIHEKADCSSADGKSSGGHWNPTREPHGAWGAEEGYHRGDIGNFTADAEGNATVEFSTDLWCLGCADETKNILGKAVIVHQGKDDFVSQPSGAAGARVSCTGIIE
ncbi:superoxide dismutase family protein [Lentiprolixibacter aurantiacus]|uniref:Superoxide dismutase family protein n=1 Tax=Lentiprolixibacter aurantiacus TaxID=2993939 RepID=A0AAE3MMX0_9FLAO|nr:superoxide dismutase family protein [Lentiprolixibacter aurantiacus]MCX2720276.1 superoxide dismutase family protein [Lentiprolixibacter aurantiacus]